MEIKKPEPETSPVHEAPRRNPAGWIWNRESLKICLFYLVFGILWIIFSDNILLSLAKRQEDVILISSVKGVLFIMVTTFLLFLLIRHFTRELLESGEKFRLLAENMVDLVAIFDAEGRFVYASPSYETVLGYSPAELLGRSGPEFLHPLDHDAAVREINRVVLSGTGSARFRYRCRDGTYRWFESTGKTIAGPGGEIGSIVMGSRDITASVEAEAALKESEEKFRLLTTGSSDVIAILDPAGKFTYITDNVVGFTGFPVGDYEGHSALEFVHSDDRKEVGAAIACLFPGNKKNLRSEFRVSRKDGGWIWIEALGTNQLDSPCIQGIVLHMRDITDRKQMEAALRESEERFRTIFNSTFGFMALLRPDGSVLGVNDTALQFGGLSLKDVVHKPFWQARWWHLSSEIQDRLKDAVVRAASGEFVRYEVDLLGKDNRIITVDFSLKPVMAGSGTVSSLVAEGRDITERKKAEEALTESELRFRKLFENNALGITMTAPDFRFVRLNPAFCAMMGYTEEELTRMTFKDITHPDHISEDTGQLRLLADKKIPVYRTEKRYIRKDGTILWASLNVSTIRSDDDQLLLYIAQVEDITGSKEAEEALRQSEMLFREVFDNANDAVFLLERPPEGPGRYLLVNEKAVTMLGYSKEELLTMSPRDIVPEDVAKTVMPGVIKKLLTDGYATFESVHRRKDGTTYPIEVSIHTFRYKGKDVDLSIIRDITDRRRAVDTLHQANKKLNLLSSITRHDLKNQLLSLNAYLGISKKSLDDTAKLSEFITKEEQIVRTMERQIAFTKEYQNIGVNVPVWQDCRTLVDTAAKQAPLGEITVKNDLPAGAELFADPMVVRMFYNLMDNAARYGGKITTIRFAIEEAGDNHIIICEDDGEGVVADEKEMIFERGFGRNTGLGLSLSREILDITGITIRETGEPGKGARFEMIVPEGVFRFTDQ